MRRKDGKIGCGCLFFFLLILLVVFGVLFHPVTLKFIAKQLVYADKIHFSDMAFVPRIGEDKDGELYLAAFEEVRKGNVKFIWIEEYDILQMSVVHVLKKLAKDRGIKEDLMRGVKLSGTEQEKSKALIELCRKAGIKKTVIFVPEYSSRRYHVLYTSSEEKEPIFLISPVKMRFFSHERWWKEGLTRELVLKEYIRLVSLYFEKLRHGKIFKFKSLKWTLSGFLSLPFPK